ncbi:MAG: DUF998 domain-containing protein [Pseudomonadota bacterium]|nr:DUF998 domain-containing protein [Pseudomonadota bacterium]
MDQLGKEIKGDIEEDKNALVIEYLNVRRALGWLGFFLPASLTIYGLLPGTYFAPSISEFYYTHMGNIFVGTMCAIGVFLVSYKGYARTDDETFSDNVLTTGAGIFAIGVALFPVVVDSPDMVALADVNLGFEGHPNLFHFGSATGFFVLLALMSMVQFTKSDRDENGKIIWTGDNLIFVVCGVVMIAALVALVPYVLSDRITEALAPYKYMFILETVGVVAFAVSWLVKGKQLGAVRAVAQMVAPAD